MTDRMGLTEFFAMEASDYLERLDALVSPPVLRDPEELVRLTRALRGSALMAKQSGIASAAEAFEAFARSVRERRRMWDEATRQLAVHAVDEFKILIRQANTWSDAEDAKAQALATELHPGSVRPPERPAVATTAGLDAGTRAFIGREGAAIASALDQAAKSLQRNPRGFEPLRHVLAVAQPLRGLAILSELTPLPELLDGVERAVSEILRSPSPIKDAALMVDAAAQAIARAAKEVATQGHAEAESRETQNFTQRLMRVVEADAAAVPIESLYFDDEGPHVVQEGSSGKRPRVLGRVELVSHGEHLSQAADEIERALSRTQLELRAQALVSTFRALSAASGSPIHDAVSRFALAARQAILVGAPVMRTPEFVSCLRDAGSVLADTGQQDDAGLAARLELVAADMSSLIVEEKKAEAPAPAAPPTDEEELEEPAPLTPPVAKVEETAPLTVPVAEVEEPEKPTPVPVAEPEVEAPAVEAVAETGAEEAVEEIDESPGLVGSWARYQRYADALGLGPPSLDELLAGPPADPRKAPEPVTAREPVTAPEPVAVPEPVAAPEPAAAVEEAIVSIAELCYSGPAALKRAASLTDEIRSGLSAGDVSPQLRDLVEEVLDLVELGIAE